MTKQRNQDTIGGKNKANKENYVPECVIKRLREEARSEPNSRSSSFRKKRHCSSSPILKNEPRSNGIPKSVHKVCSSSTVLTSECKGQFKRVRSFQLTSGGVLNVSMPIVRRRGSGSSTLSCGRSRLTSVGSADSVDTWSCSSTCSAEYYRVSIIGAPAVGKTSLQTRFMNSEYMSLDTGEDDFDDNKLTAVVDNEESTLEFLDKSVNEDDVESFPADAYIVVFSVHDKASFGIASHYLHHLRNEIDSDRPIILVANKVDLVRTRQVNTDVARQLAIDYECKYIETSAVLNYKVDELLVGLVKQIKLKLNPQAITEAALLPKDKSSKPSLCKGPKRFINKFLGRYSKSISKCDNLFDL